MIVEASATPGWALKKMLLLYPFLKEAQILTERWRMEYHTERPHSALGYRPPAPAARSRVERCLLNPLDFVF